VVCTQRKVVLWDFELLYEKRQHKEGRKFLARKMSELEARELKAAREDERRLSNTSALSGTPVSSMDRTPPSSGKKLRGTPLGETPEHPCNDIADAEVQTEDLMAQQDGRGRCKKSCKMLLWFALVVKACVIAVVVFAPELPQTMLEKVTSQAVSLVAGRVTGLMAFEGGCEEALESARLEITQLHMQMKDTLSVETSMDGLAKQDAESPSSSSPAVLASSNWFWHTWSAMTSWLPERFWR
jgi:hypothetical protein